MSRYGLAIQFRRVAVNAYIHTCCYKIIDNEAAQKREYSTKTQGVLLFNLLLVWLMLECTLCWEQHGKLCSSNICPHSLIMLYSALLHDLISALLWRHSISIDMNSVLLNSIRQPDRRWISVLWLLLPVSSQWPTGVCCQGTARVPLADGQDDLKSFALRVWQESRSPVSDS